MAKQITKESEAWLRLAEIVDTTQDYFWLCAHIDGWALLDKRAVREIAQDTRNEMLRRIAVDMYGDPDRRIVDAAPYLDSGGAHIDTEGEERQPMRVLACLMFGWEAESEGR